MKTMSVYQRQITWVLIGTFLLLTHSAATPLPGSRTDAGKTETAAAATGTDDDTGAVEKAVKTGARVEKKKFPWLLVAGSAVVIGVVLYLTVFKKSRYTLSITVGDGITGTPANGESQYKKGTQVNYNYALTPGYTNLKVTLDGSTAAASGTLTMNADHTLAVSADNGIQLEWLLDGNAQDTSGRGRHGTVHNATLTADHKGVANRAYYFNGSDAYIEGPNFNAHNNKSVSISYWLKAPASAGTLLKLVVGNAFSSGQNGSTIGYSINIPATSTAHSSISLNTWTHITGTYDGTTIRIYRDGVFIASQTHIGTPDPSGRNFALGVFNGKYWQGYIDDVRVYNYTLSDEEVQTLAGM